MSIKGQLLLLLLYLVIGGCQKEDIPIIAESITGTWVLTDLECTDLSGRIIPIGANQPIETKSRIIHKGSNTTIVYKEKPQHFSSAGDFSLTIESVIVPNSQDATSAFGATFKEQLNLQLFANRGDWSITDGALIQYWSTDVPERYYYITELTESTLQLKRNFHEVVQGEDALMTYSGTMYYSLKKE